MPRRRRRPRGRRRPRHRGRRQRGHRGGVRVPRRGAAGQAGVAGLHVQRRPVPGGTRLAAADLDGDGRIEVVGDDDQHLAERRPGLRVRRRRRAVPPERARPPRGPGTTAPAGIDSSTASGNHGYGAYGENVGIGNIDDDPQLEIIATFDNHQINAFNHDGTSILASPGSPTARVATRRGRGWAGGSSSAGPNPRVERATTTGTPARGRARQAALAPVDRVAARPSPTSTGRPQRGDRPPERRAAASPTAPGLRVHGARRRARRRRRSARRHRGLRDAADVQPGRSTDPTATGTRPPASRRRRSSTSSATAAPRSSPRCPAARSTRSGRTAAGSGPTDYARGRAKTFASEVVAADLNKRRHARAGLRHLRAAPRRRTPGRALGRAASSSPTPACATRAATATASACPPPRRSATSTGDGPLEIVLTTFDHGIDVYTVPGSRAPAALADRPRQPAPQRPGRRLDRARRLRVPPIPSPTWLA